MQRDEAVEASGAVEITEEPQPALTLEELVPDLAVQAAREPGRAPSVPSLRTARVVSVDGQKVKISFRSGQGEVEASLGPDVERDFIAEAAQHRDAVLVEVDGHNEPVVVGVLQTRRPREVVVTGEKIVIEGSREVLLRSGRAALRLREDGDIEIVGSRISAASRGLFRLVGRILRLN